MPKDRLDLPAILGSNDGNFSFSFSVFSATFLASSYFLASLSSPSSPSVILLSFRYFLTENDGEGTVGGWELGILLRLVPVVGPVGLPSWVVVNLNTWFVISDVMSLHFKCRIINIRTILLNTLTNII